MGLSLFDVRFYIWWIIVIHHAKHWKLFQPCSSSRSQTVERLTCRQTMSCFPETKRAKLLTQGSGRQAICHTVLQIHSFIPSLVIKSSNVSIYSMPLLISVLRLPKRLVYISSYKPLVTAREVDSNQGHGKTKHQENTRTQTCSRI